MAGARGLWMGDMGCGLVGVAVDRALCPHAAHVHPLS